VVNYTYFGMSDLNFSYMFEFVDKISRFLRNPIFSFQFKMTFI